MSFETLKSHDLDTAAFLNASRPVPVERPPVYDTAATIAPLLKLADYMSPEKRAQRQAIIAKANYEYWMYGPKGRNMLWKLKADQITRQNAKDDLNRRNIESQMRARERSAQPTSDLSPQQLGVLKDAGFDTSQFVHDPRGTYSETNIVAPDPSSVQQPGADGMPPTETQDTPE